MADGGARVERRGLLLIAAGGWMALAGAARGQPTPEGDFKALMAALEELGDLLPLAEPAEQDAYVHRLAARAMQTAGFPVPPMGPMGRSGVQIRPLGRTEPPTDAVHGVALVGYRLAPGALLEPHNHPNYSVATVVLDGEAHVTHYEPDAAAPPLASTEPFLVRKTAQRLLRPRQATTLTPSRDNIHTFRAGPGGARFVDLFSLHGRDVGFSYLAIEPAPAAPGGDTFRAQWTGQKPSNA